MNMQTTESSQDLGRKADPVDIACEKFMSEGADLDDPYWQLFKVKVEVNDAIVKAVEYGYKKGYAKASEELSALLK
jgi:hypothetical protein